MGVSLESEGYRAYDVDSHVDSDIIREDLFSSFLRSFERSQIENQNFCFDLSFRNFLNFCLRFIDPNSLHC